MHEDVPDPGLREPGDALVRVRLAAICGSDLHVFHGRETGLDPGTVMGHEFVGEVVECGGGVGALRPGDLVMSPFSTSCGSCPQCGRGLSARCPSGRLFGWVERGQGLQGAQAECVRVPLADSTLAVLPEGLSLEQGLLLGDVLPTGWYSAERAGVGPDGVHVVLGCGPVGLMAVVAARALGAATVLAVDSVPERLRLAVRFGARAIDLASQDVQAIVHEATHGLGADTVMEAVGSPAAARLAWELVRPGGTLSVAGVHHGSALAFSPGEAYDKNITYRTGRCPVRSLMPRLASWLREPGADVTAILTHRLPLADGPRGYRLFDAKQDGCVKVGLEP